MTPLDNLLAIEAIKNLRARYTRYIDTKDWERLPTVLAPDIHLDLPSLRQQGAVHGVEAFMSLVKTWFSTAPSLHLNFLPEIEILSATSARAVWGQENFLARLYQPGVRHGHGYGYSYDTYEKLDTWRVKSVRLEPLFTIE